MKLDCEVIGVETNGDSVDVKLQGSQTRSADWRRMGTHILTLDANSTIGKTFYVGRRVKIEVTAL